ncbi:amidohydrolase family protein [Hugenholtzia roseola]|uniref:amidohydrolase family protein n=1 Tax=Hugenholtzia roseola TaxID=1002 RepID=UPI0003FFF5BA|nr:amidohydrolase family protein [Hugenholtzia roseola]
MNIRYYRSFYLLLLLLSFVWGANASLWAQQTFYTNGSQDEREGAYAFTNATLFVDYQTRLEKATLLIKKGKVVAAGTNVAIPEGFFVIDLQGKYIYPAFIDLHAEYGMPSDEVKKQRGGAWWNVVLNPTHQKAFGNNEAIHPEVRAAELFSPDEKEASQWRKNGFAFVLTQPHDGIMRGRTALVSTAHTTPQEAILRPYTQAGMAFSKGSSSQSYPSSLMGSMALIRQSYLDAEWYQKNENTLSQTNLSLKALFEQMNQTAFFEVGEKYDILRAHKIATEFNQKYIYIGAGDEYQAMEALKKIRPTLVLPLNFPKPYDIEDPLAADFISLKHLKHWELAPHNPALLEKEGFDFAFTTKHLKSKDEFLPNLRKAVKAGLSEKVALRALTFLPAALLEESLLGHLKAGAYANFFIASDNIFAENSKIYQTWILGKKHEVETLPLFALAGKYELLLQKENQKEAYFFEVVEKQMSPQMVLWQQKGVSQDTLEATFKYNEKLPKAEVSLALSSKKEKTAKKGETLFLLQGWVENADLWSGVAKDAQGGLWAWRAQKVAPPKMEEKKQADSTQNQLAEELQQPIYAMRYPFAPFGYDEKPQAEDFIIQNTTVWTGETSQESDGILFNADVVVRKGKIAQIGQNLPTQGLKVIDGKGKYLTAGIIDEHSHIGIRGGVNEGVYSNSAEVSIEDVINPEDVNIYRHLAGGVVALQQLHGSANPIGGKSSIIKLKWGASGEEMRIAAATPRIKFALGENPRHANSPEYSRYPQTRMGVEQVFDDAFNRALIYQKQRAANPDKVRKDLQMETLLEIIQGKRLISCHSYVQTEILAMMRVAEKYGFRMNVFTHILEGYKLAPEMAAHGVGGSTFSDWWAYKYEVKDAIPHNAGLMYKAGVLTSINSDDAEMGRRLNQEAAKVVKYSDIPKMEAWKMVTLNPAKMLRLEKQMGSIAVGKDADLVLWSAEPLSVYAKVEKTFIEGALYFDLEGDQLLRKAIDAERNRLIKKMRLEKQGGADTQPFRFKPHKQYDCEEYHDFWQEEEGE